jgi:hypothetical protein
VRVDVVGVQPCVVADPLPRSHVPAADLGWGSGDRDSRAGGTEGGAQRCLPPSGNRDQPTVNQDQAVGNQDQLGGKRDQLCAIL